jgi:class 3 adenylate cyclase/tetratricopeptide (TPR) repeat protein
MSEKTTASFNTVLRQARHRAGLTQEALAERSGLGVRSIQGLERAETAPRPDTLRRLIKALHLAGEGAADFERAVVPGARRRLPHSPAAPAESGVDQNSRTLRRDPEAGSAPVGERRQLTLLTCVLSATSSLATPLDPEELTEVVPLGHEVMTQVIVRHEGRVARIVGGELVAAFGYPIVHEDDPQQAARTGLEIVATLGQLAARLERERGVALTARVGIHTGLVVVGQRRLAGPVGDDLELDLATASDTATLGAHLARSAPPNAVNLSERSYRLVQDFIECQPTGAVPIPGQAETIAVYQAAREKPVRSRFQAATARGLTPFVGRARELQVLRDAFEQARASHGQVILLCGEAGAGKSRLVLELQRAIADAGATWLEGHCIPSGQNSSYLPLVDVLKQAFGVEEADSSGRIVERIDRTAADWRDAARLTVAYLKYLLSVDPGNPSVQSMDARERRAGILDGLRALLLELSRDRPLLVVVEDLHWIDEASEAAVTTLSDVVATRSVLLLLTYRPGYSPKLPDHSYVTRVALRDLLPGESAALAEAALQVSGLPTPLQALLARKAEGNPLYLEEAVRSLLESGAIQRVDGAGALTRPIETIQVPDTLQGVILGRIDRLAPPARQALQLASVIGREFTLRLLQRISDRSAELEPAIAQLKALELIYEKGYFHELAYLFKHARTHEVAYATLLRERRRALHRVVGAAIEELYADRLAEYYDMLAHHYWEGAIWDKALEFLMKAARKATAAFANQDALVYYDQALAACDQLSPAPLEGLKAIYEGRAAVGMTINDWEGVIANYRRLADLARRVGDHNLEALALVGGAIGHVFNHEFDLALDEAHKALALVGEDGDSPARVGALFVPGLVELLRGELGPSREHLEEVVRLTRDDGGDFYALFSRHMLGINYSWRGQYARGQRFSAAAVAIGRQLHSTMLLISALFVEGLAAAGAGHYDESIVLLREATALGERAGERVHLSRAWNGLGWVYAEICNWPEAIRCNQRGLDLAVAVGEPEIVVNARTNLADCLLATGQPEQAKQDLEEMYASLPQFHEWVKWRYTQRLTHSLGEVLLATGNAERALQLADECLGLAEATESRKNVVKARRLRGEIFLVQGKLASAETELGIALEIAREIGNPPQIWKTFVVLGDLRRAQGREDEARQTYPEALAVIDSVANGLADEQLRHLFLESAHIQSIRQRMIGG